MKIPQPKVFISHASEDKDRFVIEFSKLLRQHGVDAWLDNWEMLPGDSLVDKIFEEGIKEASAVIVVLSKFSVEKPWVREELNAAWVKRINSGSKLIPVVIDDCEIPEALTSTLWIRIADLSAYEENLERILASIFGTTDKPPIGSPPKYIASFADAIGELNNIDSSVLKLSCESALKSGDLFINPEEVFKNDGAWLVPENELEDSLEVLDRQCYFKLLRTLGTGLHHYQITTSGFDVFAHACIPNYGDKVTAVISAIVNKQLDTNIEIQESLQESLVLIDHILDVLDRNGHLKQAKSIDGQSFIHNISPVLKRSLTGR